MILMIFSAFNITLSTVPFVREDFKILKKVILKNAPFFPKLVFFKYII